MDGKLGGDSELSERGVEFSSALADYMDKATSRTDCLVWTSCMRRTTETAKYVRGTHERWRALNEIDVGTCDGLSYREIRSKYPSEFRLRDVNKYGYRYPMGESYEDVVHRLEPVIMELERQTTVLVVSHQAVLR